MMSNFFGDKANN